MTPLENSIAGSPDSPQPGHGKIGVDPERANFRQLMAREDVQ